MIAREGYVWLTLPCPAILSDLSEGNPKALFHHNGQMRRREPAITLDLGEPVEVPEFEAQKIVMTYPGATISLFDQEGPTPGLTVAEERARRCKYDIIHARIRKVYAHPSLRDKVKGNSMFELARALILETQKPADEICWVLTLVSSFDMPSLGKLH